jgi:hypothetical protein
LSEGILQARCFCRLEGNILRDLTGVGK